MLSLWWLKLGWKWYMDRAAENHILHSGTHSLTHSVSTPLMHIEESRRKWGKLCRAGPKSVFKMILKKRGTRSMTFRMRCSHFAFCFAYFNFFFFLSSVSKSVLFSLYFVTYVCDAFFFVSFFSFCFIFINFMAEINNSKLNRMFLVFFIFVFKTKIKIYIHILFRWLCRIFHMPW